MVVPIVDHGRAARRGRSPEVNEMSRRGFGRSGSWITVGCQQELAAGIPGSQLVIIDGAGHNPQDEQTAEVIQVLRTFLTAKATSA